jgi:hypothetical protein
MPVNEKLPAEAEPGMPHRAAQSIGKDKNLVMRMFSSVTHALLTTIKNAVFRTNRICIRLAANLSVYNRFYAGGTISLGAPLSGHADTRFLSIRYEEFPVDGSVCVLLEIIEILHNETG